MPAPDAVPPRPRAARRSGGPRGPRPWLHHDCFGDPFTASPVDWVGTEDWLSQAVAYDTGAGADPLCTDPGNTNLENRGNEYETVRYFWAMSTVHGNSLGTMWGVWDASNPNSWNATDAGARTDDPGPRLDAAASGLPGHNTAKNHHRVTR